MNKKFNKNMRNTRKPKGNRGHNTNKDRRIKDGVVKDANPETGNESVKDQTVAKGTNIRMRSDYNDPEWYAANESLLRDAFSIATSERLGLPITVDVPLNSASASPFTTEAKYVVPGILSIDMVPTPGISRNAISPVNMAAKLVFSKVRKMNSSLSDYQATDLMMYLLAVDQGYILYNWLVRIYGLIMLYEQKNAYLPRGLYASMNVDPSVGYDMTDLRTLINSLGIRLKTLAVPTIASYYARHAWLFGGVYCDAPNDKAQLYIYNPTILYKWVEETGELQLPYLEPVKILNTEIPWRLDGLRSLVEEIIEPLVFSDDFRLMAGDIRKAFDESELYSVTELDPDYICLPTYIPEVLSQIENAKCLGQWDTQTFDATWRIQQEAAHEAIIFNPTVKVSTGLLGDKFLYNFHVEDVDPRVAAVATRLNFVVDTTTITPAPGAREVSTKLASCGTELVTSYRVFTLNNGNYESTAFGNVLELYSDQPLGTFIPEITTMLKVSQFDWAPILQVFTMKGDGTQPGFSGYLCDLDNYTQIDSSKLITMNDTALLSLFGVPNGYTTRTHI